MSDDKDFYLYDLMTGDLIILFNGIIIGRVNCDVNFSSDAKMSSKHVEFNIREKRLFIRDLGSKNRSKINGVAIVPNQWVELRPEDVLGFGSQKFEITEEVVSHSTKQMKERNLNLLRQLDEKDQYSYDEEINEVQKQMTQLQHKLDKKVESLESFQSQIIDVEQAFMDELVELEKEREQFYLSLENIKKIYLKRVNQLLKKKEMVTVQRHNLQKIFEQEKKQMAQMRSEISSLGNKIPKKKSG